MSRPTRLHHRVKGTTRRGMNHLPLSLGKRWRCVMCRYEAQPVSFKTIECSEFCIANPGALSSIVAKIGSRSPGALDMTWSTSDVAVCCSSDCLQFIEQPRVLDGNDGLRCEVC